MDEHLRNDKVHEALSSDGKNSIKRALDMDRKTAIFNTVKIMSLTFFTILTLVATDCAAEPQFEGFGFSGRAGGTNGQDWITGGIMGRFGEKPAKIKPIRTEKADDVEAKPQKVSSEYNFSTDLVRVAQPAYMPIARVANFDLIAKNKGHFPVSVIVNADPDLLHTSVPLPFTSVVPPKSEKALIQLKRNAKNGLEKINYMLFWELGSYEAKHDENYIYYLPFNKNVRAFASVYEGVGKITPYTRYAVIFSMPPKTSVLAAREGVIVRIQRNSLDILHDDSTIGTYSHLGGITSGLYVGKPIKSGDILSVAGLSEDGKESFIQLTVWRLGLNVDQASTANTPSKSKFYHISVPLKFCVDSSNVCEVLAKSRLISRKK